MGNYAIAFTISIVYFIIKYVENHIIKKDHVPLKKMMRETFIVFLATICGFFIFGQLRPIINETIQPRGGGSSVAFTDNPTF
jgi:hypothetical protein